MPTSLSSAAPAPASTWDHIRVFFHDSQTLVWARLQVLGGIVFGYISTADPDLIRQAVEALNLAKYWPLLLIAAGLITEYVRRMKEPHNLGVSTVADLSTVMVPIKKSDAVNIDPVTNAVTITPSAVPAVPLGVVPKAAGE
jgi:hypothetical protein